MYISLSELGGFIFVLTISNLVFIGGIAIVFKYLMSDKQPVKYVKETDMVTDLSHVEPNQEFYEDVEEEFTKAFGDSYPEHEVGQEPSDEPTEFDIRIDAIKKDLERKQQMPKEFFDYEEDGYMKEKGLYKPAIFEDNEETDAGTEIITEEFEAQMEKRIK